MRSVAFTLDGVLRKDPSAENRDNGAYLLYLAMAEHFRVVILGSQDKEADEFFLAVNNIVKYAAVESENILDHPYTSGRRQQQLTRLRSEGYQFEFVVVPDPWMAKWLFTAGYPVLLYLSPEYSATAFRPDTKSGARPWGELIQQVDYTRSMKARMAEEARAEDDV